MLYFEKFKQIDWPQGIPNYLTISRIAIIPVIVACFYIPFKFASWIIAALYFYACITDFFDGYIARLWQQTSNFGRFLDPIADKLLVASILIMMVGTSRLKGISLIPVIIIMCREISVSGLREFLADIHVKVPVSYLAKWKTALQMIAIFLLILSQEKLFGVSFKTLGVAGLWVAALLTLASGIEYFYASVIHFQEAPNHDQKNVL